MMTYNPPPTPLADAHWSNVTFDSGVPTISSLPRVPRLAYAPPPWEDEEDEEKEVEEMDALADSPVREI